MGEKEREQGQEQVQGDPAQDTEKARVEQERKLSTPESAEGGEAEPATEPADESKDADEDEDKD